jgi:hypothetical protein
MFCVTASDNSASLLQDQFIICSQFTQPELFFAMTQIKLSIDISCSDPCGI